MPLAVSLGGAPEGAASWGLFPLRRGSVTVTIRAKIEVSDLDIHKALQRQNA